MKETDIANCAEQILLNDGCDFDFLKKEHFGVIINSIHRGIVAIDKNGFIIIANKTAGTLLGMASKNLVKKQITEIFPAAILPQIVKQGQPRLGEKILLGDTPVLADYAPIIIKGELAGAISIFWDMSSMEVIADELKYMKTLVKELEATINYSYDGIFITDGEGIVLLVNKAYERITGIKEEEVIGKNMKDLIEADYYDQSVTLLVMEKLESLTINQTVRGNRNILVTGNPIFNEEGQLTRVVTNVRDVTEFVHLQEQLNKSKEQALKYQSELSYLRSIHIREKNLIYRSQSMVRVVELASKIADVDSNVLISGESGTGKELIAQLIHKEGKGTEKPFIKVNCGAIPANLLESELFGYEGGAFTGARKEGKLGMFELAHNGTLFLDEIGELSLDLQVKLLRAIQDKEILRLGGVRPIKVNVRIIAATHRDIAKMMQEGTFRQDLYYRLMVIPIKLENLRNRKEDIPVLVLHFVEKFNKRFRYNKSICLKAIDKLTEYSWPGNVRELENIIERMIVTTVDDKITVDDLPEAIRFSNFLPPKGRKLKTAVEQTESFLLEKSFQECQSWNKVALELGINRATVYRKAAKYGLLK